MLLGVQRWTGVGGENIVAIAAVVVVRSSSSSGSIDKVNGASPDAP